MERKLIEIDFKQLARTVTFPKILNLVKIELSFAISKIFKKAILWGKPYILTVEPSSLCNLKCPLCAVGANKLTRKQGLLALPIYRQLLQELGPNLFEILLFNQGEPFLHPNLTEFIRQAKQQKIYTTISTNGHFLNDPVKVLDLIDSGLDVLLVSLDGATARSYENYRQGGDFQKVVDGIRFVQSVKQQKNTRHPAVFLQFLVMRHNEHEIANFRELAKNLQVDRVLFKSLQVENASEGDQFLPIAQRFQRYFKHNGKLLLKRKSKINCGRLWRSTVLLSDGKIVGCCFDKDGQFSAGTLSATNLFNQIWHGKQYNQMRNQMLQHHTIGDICLNCTEGVKIYN